MVFEYLLIFFQSFLEAIWVLVIVSIINTRAKLDRVETILFADVIASVSLIMNINNLPYHSAVTIAVSSALFLALKWPSKRFWGIYLVDILVSFVVLSLTELLVTAAAGLFSINLLDNGIALLVLLVLMILLFKWLSTKLFVYIFLEKYYLPYRMIILFAAISAIFLITIVFNMIINHTELLFLSGSGDVYLLIIGYFVVNLFFVISMYHTKVATEKSNALMQYSERLQSVINENRAFSHDLKHLLQIINNLNTNPDGRVRNYELDKYLNSLIYDNTASDTSIIKDDVLISSLLYQKQEYATRRKIDFTVNIMNPITDYYRYIPRIDLIDVLNNLLNNAFEEVDRLDEENRIVQIDFTDYYIEIRNSVSISLSRGGANKTSQFFKQGYSTKGSDRGFGLSNVLSIAKRNNIEIKQDMSGELIVFRLEFTVL